MDPVTLPEAAPAAFDLPLADKVAALRTPRCYPRPARPIESIETHMSWVFLTPHDAWKLKKPVRYDHQDFRSVAGRRFFCEEELRLNRRLAPDVYLEVVPLTREGDGTLRLAGTGTPVDWLVRMRRLPAREMLDALLARGEATTAHMRAIAQRLCRFQAGQPPAPVDAASYRALLRRHLQEAERELCRPAWALPAARIQALVGALRTTLREQPQLFDARVAAGRVLEGHGDLRPEHVWLGEPLAIIDCLEFSPQLRLQDAADETAYLALECERARAPALARELLDAWLGCSGDPVPPALLHWYQACRACARAALAVRHLHEPRYRASSKWRLRALRYLVLAQRHLRAGGLSPAAAR